MRKVLTNATWAVLKPHVAPTARPACGAEPLVSDRVFLEALLDTARTGRPPTCSGTASSSPTKPRPKT